MGWANPTLPTRETQGDRPIPQISRELVEKSESDMSSLAVGFAARMRKRATSAQGETTPGFEVPGGKRPKWSGLNEEIQKCLIVITSDSLERASSAFSTLEGATKDASREACASLEDGNLAGGPPSADKVVGQAPSAETTVGSSLLDRRSSLIITGPCRPRGLDKLVDHLSSDTSVPSPYAAQPIIDCWNPFNQRDAFVTNMHELYPTNLRIPVVALCEEYFIPFPVYMDKKSHQRVTENGMYIRNHDFNETTELVRLDF